MLKNIKMPKFIADVSSLLSSHIIMAAIEITISILIARVLGPSGKGIFTTAIVTTNLVLSFTYLGLGSAITYFMGKKKYTDQEIISSISLLIIFTTLLGIIITLLAFSITGFQLRYGWAIIAISISLIPARMVMAYANGILMAKGRIPKIASINVIPDIIYLAGVVIILIFGTLSVELVLLCQVLSVYITAGYILMTIRVYGKFTPLFMPDIIWNMIRKGIIYAIATFVVGVNYSIDNLILERLTNSTEVGIYSVGVSLASLVWLLPNVINTVNFSHSAISDDPLAYAKKTATILRVILWIAIVPVLVLYFVSPYIIPLIYGDAYAMSGIVSQVILPGIWAMLIFRTLHGDLAGRGRPDITIWIYLVTAGLNIALNFWWDPLFGAVGAAWASTVCYIVGGFIFGIVYARISNLRLSELFIIQITDLEPLRKMFVKL